MGTLAVRSDLDISGACADVDVSMTDKPRLRIGAIDIVVTVPGAFSDRDRTRLEQAAEHCPIKNSFGSDVPISISLDTVKMKLHAQDSGLRPYTRVWAAHAGHQARCQRMSRPNADWGFLSACEQMPHPWQMPASIRVTVPIESSFRLAVILSASFCSYRRHAVQKGYTAGSGIRPLARSGR